ncbi:MAG: hypothetical protein IPH77_15860 [Ignavibacteria bacterium]|nr:hypothetical protein [Ignavibacteria bacterium]
MFQKVIVCSERYFKVRPIRSNIQYDLLNAPPNVTITNDSIINISTLNQTFREKEFKVIASIGGSASLRDTMIYKLIDTTKEDFTGNGIVSLELFSPLERQMERICDGRRHSNSFTELLFPRLM